MGLIPTSRSDKPLASSFGIILFSQGEVVFHKFHRIHLSFDINSKRPHRDAHCIPDMFIAFFPGCYSRDTIAWYQLSNLLNSIH